MLEALREKNNRFKIYSVNDKEFNEFGRVLKLDSASLIEKAEAIKMPEAGIVYTPAVPELEADALFQTLQDDYYGQLPIQVGICLGHSKQLNALEWHTASEINIAVTPLVLMLGRRQDMVDGKFDSANVKMFYLEKGEAVEVYATSMHYAPCKVQDSGFSCIVVLPKDTNTALDKKGDITLRAKNKWLIAHVENERLLSGGAAAGIYGENFELKVVD